MVLALPEIERGLHVALTSVVWVVIGYLLVITLLATQKGRRHTGVAALDLEEPRLCHFRGDGQAARPPGQRFAYRPAHPLLHLGGRDGSRRRFFRYPGRPAQGAGGGGRHILLKSTSADHPHAAQDRRGGSFAAVGWRRAREHLERWAKEGQRVTGAPTSANGASSFHLWWALPEPGPLSEVRAVLEVVRPPSVPRLYFWALQVSFVERGRELGAGHTGLQWHPGAPDGAVNWGGYATGGGVLEGSGSHLAPVDGPHTRHFPWAPRRPYRLRVWSPAAGAWRSEVTDAQDGTTTVVRDLFVPASSLASPLVWSEVFARCDDPSTEVRWSGLEAVLPTGQVLTATSARLTYQSHAEGGCANTESRAEDRYFVQATGLPGPRRPGPEVLSLPAAP
ncbi:MAG: hypothetical protein ACRDZX_13560 [Acidimicrobiales bacterium]